MCRLTRSCQRDLLRFRRWRRQTGGDTLGYGSTYKQIGSAVEMCMPLWYNNNKTAMIPLSAAFRLAAKQPPERLIISKERSP